MSNINIEAKVSLVGSLVRKSGYIDNGEEIISKGNTFIYNTTIPNDTNSLIIKAFYIGVGDVKRTVDIEVKIPSSLTEDNYITRIIHNLGEVK